MGNYLLGTKKVSVIGVTLENGKKSTKYSNFLT